MGSFNETEGILGTAYRYYFGSFNEVKRVGNKYLSLVQSVISIIGMIKSIKQEKDKKKDILSSTKDHPLIPNPYICFFGYKSGVSFVWRTTDGIKAYKSSTLLTQLFGGEHLLW